MMLMFFLWAEAAPVGTLKDQTTAVVAELVV
jgi:hypothetical protein